MGFLKMVGNIQTAGRQLVCMKSLIKINDPKIKLQRVKNKPGTQTQCTRQPWQIKYSYRPAVNYS